MSRLLSLLLLSALLLFAPRADAALDVVVLRKHYSGTASSGTWLRIDLPAYTTSVWIEVDGAAWIDGVAGGYTDGGARSSGGRATTTGEVVIWPVPSSSSGASIYVAGNGGSRTVTVQAFGSEAK